MLVELIECKLLYYPALDLIIQVHEWTNQLSRLLCMGSSYMILGRAMEKFNLCLNHVSYPLTTPSLICVCLTES